VPIRGTKKLKDGNYFQMYQYGNDKDTIRGDYGPDTIYTYGGDDDIRGYRGDDYIHAGDGDDTIRGYEGDDIIDAGEGHDCVYGGTGKDFIVGDGGNDVIWGEEGDDCIVGDYMASTLQGNEGIDLIDGGPGDDGVFCSNATFLLGQWCEPSGGADDGKDGQCSANCGGEVLHSCNSGYYGYCDGNYVDCMPTSGCTAP